MALFGDLTYDSRVRKEARSLADSGYDVTIVCLASQGSGTDLPASVTVLIRQPTGALVLPGSSNPFLRDPPGRIHAARARLGWLSDYVRGLRSWGRLAVDAAGPVDAWHAHDLTGLAAIAPSLRRGIPLVYDSHELYLEAGTAAMLPGLARRILGLYERRLVARAAAVITVNDEIAAELLHRYRPRVVAVVHNCPVLPPSRQTEPLIRNTAGIPDGSPVILYHGGLTAGRGIDLLMEALLQEGLEGAHLVLMGYGPMAAGLRAQAGADLWRGRVHVLEPVPPSSLLAWVASADVGAMVNPGRTLNDVYSSPNKLFECIAAGTPVVASDFPALRRIIMDAPGGPLGAVCDPHAVASIAGAIRSLLRLSPAEAMLLRARCRRAAEARWNWDGEAATLLAVYRGLGLGPVQPPPDLAGAREGGG